MFIFGVLVGCALFAIFQSYVFIVALLGVISLISKLPPLLAKAIKQNQKEES
jgi:hypothetical protein